MGFTNGEHSGFRMRVVREAPAVEVMCFVSCPDVLGKSHKNGQAVTDVTKCQVKKRLKDCFSELKSALFGYELS